MQEQTPPPPGDVPAADTPPARYPQRGSCYAHRHQRLMAKVCAAQQIGAAAAWLVTTIAHQEDAKRYSGPVTFFNEQLMPILGVASRSSLVRARQKAVEAGWLHYEPGGKGRPGKYWVTTPPAAAALDDSPVDETPPQAPLAAFRTETVRQTGETAATVEHSRAALPSTLCTASGRQRDGNSAPFFPVPDPSPEESKSDGSDEPVGKQIGQRPAQEPAVRESADCRPVTRPVPRGVSQPAIRVARRTTPPALRRIRRREDLSNTAGLVALHRELTGDPACPVSGSEHQLLQLVTLAEHCLRPDKPIRSPTAVFVSRIRSGDFEGLTQAEEDRARARLRDWRAGRLPEGSQHTAGQSVSPAQTRASVMALAARFGKAAEARAMAPDPWEQADQRRELMRAAMEARFGTGCRAQQRAAHSAPAGIRLKVTA